jgi:hypothetical protein
MQAICVQTEAGWVERIEDGGETLAILIRDEFEPAETTFLTPPGYKQQVGFVVYPAGSEIPRHEHLQLERSIRGAAECLVVRRGRSEVTLYNNRRDVVCRRTLKTGDVLLLVAGGHGFRQIEDTVFLEIKQGPYPGIEEKERF